jgi:hypothetical protein
MAYIINYPNNKIDILGRVILRIILIVLNNCYFNRKNVFSAAGDIACDFGRGNVNKNDLSADVESMCLLKQDLWKNFIFGQTNYQKYDSHIQEIVADIVKNNNLKPITPLSELCSGNDDVSIDYCLFYMLV